MSKKSKKKSRGNAKADQPKEAAANPNNTKQNQQASPRPSVAAGHVLQGTGGSKKQPCSHGFSQDMGSPMNANFMGMSGMFIQMFTQTYLKYMHSDPTGNVINALNAARAATQNPTFHFVWSDASKLEWVMSFFLNEGTKYFLQGNNETMTRHSAIMASHFEQSMKMASGKRAQVLPAKIAELLRGDMKTLVTYYRQRIPCDCLDKKYEEVKSVTKLGFCCNVACPIPDRMVERKKMLYCTQCRETNYCSRECQVAHWPDHKDGCAKYSKQKEKISAAKKKEAKAQ